MSSNIHVWPPLLIIIAVLGCKAYASPPNGFCMLKCVNKGARNGACVSPHTIQNKDCPSDTIIFRMTVYGYMGQILTKHNELRKSVAIGMVTNLPPASRMGEVYWDHQLAFLAHYSAGRCKLVDSYCYRTRLLQNSGRVARLFKFDHENYTKPFAIKFRIDEWFQEIEQSLVTFKSIIPPFDSELSAAAHILKEENNRIGCSISKWHSKEGYEALLFVCLYATEIKEDIPIYTDGKTASKCKMIHSVLYPNLCSINEEYNYKEHFPQYKPALETHSHRFRRFI